MRGHLTSTNLPCTRQTYTADHQWNNKYPLEILATELTDSGVEAWIRPPCKHFRTVYNSTLPVFEYADRKDLASRNNTAFNIDIKIDSIRFSM
ncbi:hypothetical protein AVEN_127862-1 [Araneus ventricosus]|uniref:Uncharacterized protein n=1 Tax=Araneus ventricosus TaxID=182803 RepID=A0A4Y1ZYP7_ARAVE|nr:hypothetical protein AVEN_127862-1 [Araneus ventricosus]